MSGKPQILVLGGGFGGLEAAFYLRMRLQEAADITLVSDKDYFLFKPNTIYIPFGLDPQALHVNLLNPLRRKQITFIQARARSVDPLTKTVMLDNGQLVRYDYLIVATGATMRPAEIPGLLEHAQTIWTPEEMLRLRGALDLLVKNARRGIQQRVLFVVPPNNKCAGPLYEMVFMLDTWLNRQQVRDQVFITWTTYEGAYIQAFGPMLHETALGEFVRRGISHHTHYAIERIEPHVAHFGNSIHLPFDLLISFPPYIAAAPFDSLPSDDRGFVSTAPSTRQVVGYPEIYVAGDAGDFPVKQAFLAFLQADAIAEHLSAQILGGEPAFQFEPISMCVMDAGLGAPPPTAP
jgi:sulfide:quinone oxidoreductase